MHYWGDDTVDWAGINDAAHYIGHGLRKWGRVSYAADKEKFGTVRVYCHLGFSWWPQLTHPGYVYNPWPKWMWRFCYPPRWVQWLVNIVVVPYHKVLYRTLYRRAVARWPHLREEILCAADYDELLRGL